MKKQLIKEAKRMQQLAGIINENFVGLAPINSPINEEDDDDTEDLFGDEPEDNWNKPDEFDTDTDEKEPTGKDIKNVGMPVDNDDEDDMTVPVTVDFKILTSPSGNSIVKVGSRMYPAPTGVSKDAIKAAMMKGLKDGESPSDILDNLMIGSED